MQVLLAIDGSDPSMTALAAVAALRLPEGSTIELLTVIADDREAFGGVWPAAVLVQPKDARARAHREVRERLESLAERLAGDGRTATVKIREGRAASEILLEAGSLGADLVVVGARGQSTVDRILLGSVSSEVVDHAHCPVLVVRTDGVQRVLVATDGSADALRAVDFLGGPGPFGSATFRVLSVTDPGMPWWTGVSPVDGMIAAEVYGDMVDIARQQARETAAHAAERLGSEVTVEEAGHRGGGVPSAIIAEATAWNADIVVVGSRGLGLVRRTLLGSVSRDVLHHAPMSVLIVPAGGASESTSASADEVSVAAG